MDRQGGCLVAKIKHLRVAKTHPLSKKVINMKKLNKFTSRNFITDRWLAQNPGATIECWNCGKLIIQDDPRRKYCNDRCKKRYWRAVRKVIRTELCEWCEEVFELSRRDQRFCSKRCIDSARRERKGVPVMGKVKEKCPTCTVLFIKDHSQRKYCSFRCFYVNRLKKKRQYNRHVRDSKAKDKNKEIGVTEEEVRETLGYLKKVHGADEFDPSDWRSRAKEAEKRLVAKYGIRRALS